MNCPTCGASLPDGSVFCTTCGSQIGQAAGSGMSLANDAYGATAPVNQGQYGAQGSFGGPAPAVAPSYPSMQPGKTGSKAGIIIAICLVVAAAAVVAVIFLMKGGSGEYDGTYNFVSAEVSGMSFTKEELENMSGQKFDMKLTIKGNKITIDAEDMGIEKGTGTVTIKGSTVTIEDSNETLTGEYDSATKTITVTAGGATMHFQKK